MILRPASFPKDDGPRLGLIVFLTSVGLGSIQTRLDHHYGQRLQTPRGGHPKLLRQSLFLPDAEQMTSR